MHDLIFLYQWQKSLVKLDIGIQVLLIEFGNNFDYHKKQVSINFLNHNSELNQNDTIEAENLELKIEVNLDKTWKTPCNEWSSDQWMEPSYLM